MVDEKGFREFIKNAKRVPKGISERTIGSHIRMVKEFEDFLAKRRSTKQFKNARERDLRAFMKHLAKTDRNTFDNLIGLLRYARFTGNEDAELALLAMLDGSDILGIMCDTVRRKYGKGKGDELLRGFVPPAIGTSFKLMPKVTSEFMSRLESGIGEEATRELLLTGPHAAAPEYHLEERRMLRGSKSIDEYLRRRRKKFIRELTGHMNNGTFFFNQKINQDVIDFVRRNPEIAGGVRKGYLIYCTKVPYMAIEYLREKDSTMKRYYYCHCPLARESIPSGKAMSRNFCYCSAGFEKRPFDVAFGVPLSAKVKKSVLWGDSVCQFVLEIPKRYRAKTA